MGRILTRIFAFTIIIAILSSIIGCSSSSEQSRQMDQAENLMESQPDSALAILNGIQPDNLHGKKQHARYALLKSMALDKNYIDTTTFDVLQPAIDYYLESGTPDEKLKTYYYQGRIYQNQGDNESALKAMLYATDYNGIAIDTLMIARNSVALGTIYIQQYNVEKFIQSNLLAAQLYSNIGNTKQIIKAYCNVLDGYVMQRDKTRADSILSLTKHILDGNSDLSIPSESILSYVTAFGNQAEIQNFLNEHQKTEQNLDDELSYAVAYAKIGMSEEADKMLSNINSRPLSRFDSLKYKSTEVLVQKGKGDYKAALEAYEQFASMQEKFQLNLMSQDLLFADERHRIELNNLNQIKHLDNIIFGISMVVLSLLLLCSFIYYRNHLLKTKRIAFQKEIENLRLKEENLQKENERMSLEQERRLLEIENLELEKTQLESERDNLNDLLAKQTELAKPLQDIIKERLDMLNGILAKEITNNDTYDKPYRKWIESVRSDKVAFMNSNRKAFSVSHPEFMSFLQDHNLSEEEINYICLYALGLRGKEVGEYMNLKRHYQISSDIRRKLNIETTETNIGLYIRRKLSNLNA